MTDSSLTSCLVQSPRGFSGALFSPEGLRWFSLPVKEQAPAARSLMAQWIKRAGDKAAFQPEMLSVGKAPKGPAWQWLEELGHYWEGRITRLEAPLQPEPATPFQWTVWQEARKIPYGETRTYGQLAAAIGKDGGARAVGQAMKRNPLPLFIPCHRVVASCGMGGFSAPGGAGQKALLLDWEKKNLAEGQG